jgi:hypothetical protein
MTHLGNYQLGDHVRLVCECKTSSGVPTEPDSAPTVSVFSPTATIINNKTIPPLDRYNATGVFSYELFLGASTWVPGLFAAGKLWVLYNWVIAGVSGADIDCFDILAGGHANGSVIAMHWLEKPHGNYIVMQLNSGRLIKRRNPSL